MFDPTEIQGAAPLEQSVSQEQLNRWIETGFNDEAVAVMGVNIEVLNGTLETGHIPRWLERTETPRLSLIGDNKYVYYAIPFLDKIRQLNSTLATNLEPSDHPINDAKDYASISALRDGFYKATDIFLNVGELEELEDVLFPTQEDPRTTNLADDRDEAEQILARVANKGISRERVAEVLRGIGDRKGVLIYLNKRLLNEAVVPDPEDPKWLMVITKHLLLADVISGIEILSDTDKIVLETKSKVT